MRSCLILLALTALLAGPCPARGQDEDVGALNNQAIAWFKAGDYAKAVTAWLTAIDNAPAGYEYVWAFHMNVGRAFQKLDMYPEAWWYLARAIRLNPKADKTPGWLTEVEDKLKAAHVKVTIEANAKLAQVALMHGQTQRWYDLPTEWWLLPGTVKLSARARGCQDRTTEVLVTKETTTVTLTLLAQPAARPPAEVKPRTGPIESPGGEEPEDKGGPAWWKWAVLGSSAVLAAAGGTLLYMAADNADMARQDFREDHPELDDPVSDEEAGRLQDDWERVVSDEVEPYAISSYVFFGLAGAALVAGGALLYPDLTAVHPDETAAAFGPLLGPGTVGIRGGVGF